MKICVFTLGCKVNRYESENIINALKHRGFYVTDSLQQCDKYIINTCAVTKEAERKSKQVISKINKINPAADIYIIGCASQYNAQAFAKKQNIKIVCGTAGKHNIINSLEKEGLIQNPLVSDYEEVYSGGKKSAPLKTRAYIKIQDGCNNYCSYCIIPYLRGASRSRSMQNIRQEIISLQGTVKEFVITGINISDYGKNEGTSLSKLLDYISDITARIRLGSLEAGIVEEDLLLAAKKLKNFCPHFHLSLQSGSDSVLKSMNRHYTAADYLNSVKLIRKFYSYAAITTDIICGFPTETEQDFENTLNVCKEADFADIHIFNYSKREGTAAAKLITLNKEIVTKRANKLKELKEQFKYNFIQKNRDRTLYMLAEKAENGYTEGYSKNYIKLFVKGNLTVNQVYAVRITGHIKGGAQAQLI